MSGCTPIPLGVDNMTFEECMMEIERAQRSYRRGVVNAAVMHMRIAEAATRIVAICHEGLRPYAVESDKREIAEAQQRWEDNRKAEAAEARKQYQQAKQAGMI